MANTIRHKRGTTTPAASALVTGEIAINTATGAAFTKTDGGTVVSLGGGITASDLGNGNTTAGNLVIDALKNANAPSATNQFATDGDLNSAVASFSSQVAACKAWVNFNGTGTVAIRAAYNVTSITDNGVGDYTLNFTTAFADTNYALTTSNSGMFGVAVGLTSGSITANTTPTTKTTTAARIVSTYYDNNRYDIADIGVAIFR